MIPIKNCSFCNQPTTYVPLTVGTGNRPRIMKVHYCQRCDAEYVFWGDDGILSGTHLYTMVNGKMYRWSTGVNESGGRLWYVAEPGIPGSQPNKGVQLLKSLEAAPQITPQNVEEKIRFILLFL